MKIFTYDTTLRDGAQSEGISFSLEDKLKIIKKLDDFCIDYIECGWPGSNPKDIELFKILQTLEKKHSKITAFGSTRYKNIKVEDDKNLLAMIDSKPDAVCLFGKSWNLHVKDALETTLDENLSMIYDSIKFLKTNGLEVIYDAEHFFDGYKENNEYAITTLKVAEEAGADFVCLCDTNGGLLPFEIESILSDVRCNIKSNIGIHTHNDSGMASANSILAIANGAIMVQGTINGYGERCGNADLTTIIPSLSFKMGLDTSVNIKMLKEVSYFVSDVANKAPQDNQPYVGYSAFTHKAGIHASAVVKNSKTYEHISPEHVGNKRRIVVSELSGKSNILAKANEINVNIDSDEKIKEILDYIKINESNGYNYESAEASLELIIRKFSVNNYNKFFVLDEFKVEIEKEITGIITSKANIKINVNGVLGNSVAEGDGPVNALDNALRMALERFYPELKTVSLSDFKVRVIGSGGGTGSKVRVLIESRDLFDEWTTIGVSENIIEATWQALSDALEYKLLKDKDKVLI